MATLTADQLQTIAEGLVTAAVNKIESLFKTISTSASLKEALSVLLEIIDIWISLEPAMTIIQALFPAMAPVFTILDDVTAVLQKLLTAQVAA
jgi:hypothetical protein